MTSSRKYFISKLSLSQPVDVAIASVGSKTNGAFGFQVLLILILSLIL